MSDTRPLRPTLVVIRDEPGEFYPRYPDPDYRKRLAALPPGERATFGLRIFDLSREITRSEIRHHRPHLTDVEVEKKLFLRFYGRELPQAQIDRVLRGIYERRLGRTRIIDAGTPEARTVPEIREQ